MQSTFPISDISGHADAGMATGWGKAAFFLCLFFSFLLLDHSNQSASRSSSSEIEGPQNTSTELSLQVLLKDAQNLPLQDASLQILRQEKQSYVLLASLKASASGLVDAALKAGTYLHH